MSFARSVASRSSRSLGASLSGVRSSGLRQCQRLARRNYATASETAKKGAEAAKSGLTSELPWLLGAVGITVPGTYLLLNSGNLDNPLSYPLPGSKHHGHHDDEEHEEHDEEETEEEAPAEEEEAEKPAEDAEENEDSSNKSEESSSDSDNQTADSSSDSSDVGEGKTMPENPDDNNISKKTASGEQGKFDEETELESDDPNQKVIHKPDAKGGAKRRIESPNAFKLGEGSQPTDDSKGDPPRDAAAPSKEPVQGETSQKQAGLSNTDTKHSTDIGNDPEKSKKGEGVPETAKMQGTVDSNRPLA